MILGILQARASSRRLPGKVLKPILGRPMLERQVERLRRARCMDGLVVATSTDVSDDPIAALCESLAIDCFRGSLGDVLDRFYRAARRYAPSAVVRLTGDCPFADPHVVDGLVETHIRKGYDYTANTLQPRQIPDGLDVEAIAMSCLETAWREATLPSEHEHVTPFIYNHRERFQFEWQEQPTDLSALCWVVRLPFCLCCL